MVREFLSYIDMLFSNAVAGRGFLATEFHGSEEVPASKALPQSAPCLFACDLGRMGYQTHRSYFGFAGFYSHIVPSAVHPILSVSHELV